MQHQYRLLRDVIALHGVAPLHYCMVLPIYSIAWAPVLRIGKNSTENIGKTENI